MLEPLRSPAAKHPNRSPELTEQVRFHARRQECGLIHTWNPPGKMQRGFGLGVTPNQRRQSMTRHFASIRREGGES
jgi:hypothetical protein